MMGVHFGAEDAARACFHYIDIRRNYSMPWETQWARMEGWLVEGIAGGGCFCRVRACTRAVAAGRAARNGATWLEVEDRLDELFAVCGFPLQFTDVRALRESA